MRRLLQEFVQIWDLPLMLSSLRDMVAQELDAGTGKHIRVPDSKTTQGGQRQSSSPCCFVTPVSDGRWSWSNCETKILIFNGATTCRRTGSGQALLSTILFGALGGCSWLYCFLDIRLLMFVYIQLLEPCGYGCCLPAKAVGHHYVSLIQLNYNNTIFAETISMGTGIMNAASNYLQYISLLSLVASSELKNNILTRTSRNRLFLEVVTTTNAGHRPRSQTSWILHRRMRRWAPKGSDVAS